MQPAGCADGVGSHQGRQIVLVAEVAVAVAASIRHIKVRKIRSEKVKRRKNIITLSQKKFK